MKQDANRQVRLLWDDHVGGENNATLLAVGVSHAVRERYTAAWYGFRTAKDIPFISLDATAGITNMRFTVNSKLEDQGGVGFAVQDGVVFAETSCVTARNQFRFPTAARFDIGVRV
jgi:hypothetical protein